MSNEFDQKEFVLKLFIRSFLIKNNFMEEVGLGTHIADATRYAVMNMNANIERQMYISPKHMDAFTGILSTLGKNTSKNKDK